jgi:hypothetical protein
MVHKEGQIVYSTFAPLIDYDPPVLYENMVQDSNCKFAAIVNLDFSGFNVAKVYLCG